MQENPLARLGWPTENLFPQQAAALLFHAGAGGGDMRLLSKEEWSDRIQSAKKVRLFSDADIDGLVVISKNANADFFK